MEADKPVTVMCTLIAMDHSKFCYSVCSICERTLPENPNSGPSSLCRFCNFNNAFNHGPSASKRLFRVLISIATATKVITVICFDRAARVFFGCSADEFYEFAKLHPSAASTAAELLEGEMFRMTLSRPKNGNAQHIRAVQIVPLRTGFQPVIVSLREAYGLRSCS